MANDKVIDRLNDLLEKHYDAQEGFKKVSEKTDSQYLKNIFNHGIKLHSSLGEKVQMEIKSLGGKPKSEGTFAGQMHRSWIDVKSLFSTDNEESILEACITGEKKCIEECEDVLEVDGLPISTKNLINSQCSMINASLQKMKNEEELRD